jgi:hypothetical protein
VKPSVTRSACNCFIVHRSFRDFPALAFSQPASLSAKGAILLCRPGVANFGSMVFAARCLVTPQPLVSNPLSRFVNKPLQGNEWRPMASMCDTPVSRAIPLIDSFCRKCIRLMMFNSPMWITPLPPPLTALGVGSHSSVLSENYSPNLIIYNLKSTV